MAVAGGINVTVNIYSYKFNPFCVIFSFTLDVKCRLLTLIISGFSFHSFHARHVSDAGLG